MSTKAHEYSAPQPSSAANGRVASVTRPHPGAMRGFRGFLGRYFYFSMSLLMAVLGVWAFSHTVDVRLLHAKPPRPLLLWFHSAVFSAWIAVFVAQSSLVRLHKVRVHRTLGWFGAALALLMVVSGFVVSIIMIRFETTVLRQNVASFLSILWCDLIIFGACMALAIYFRKRPEYHRRLVFLANCQLMQAVFVRFHYLGHHALYFPALDVLIVLGMLRDLIVDGRVNKIYAYGFPAIIVLQSLSTYLQRGNPSWWQAATQMILR